MDGGGKEVPNSCVVDVQQAQDEGVYQPLEEDLDPEEIELTENDCQKKKVVRVRWETEEIEEINTYFKNYLKTKTVPNKQDCLKAIAKSKAAHGMLQRRYWHTIVKKISNLYKK